MAKNHLKRLNAPKTWPITRKETVYTMRPRPSGHAMEAGITLNTLLKDELQMARTARGVRTILNTQDVLVNGKKQLRPEALAGLFDVVTFPAIKTSFRILINTKNTLFALPISGGETNLIPSKVTNKTLLAKGKQQLGFHNGLTLLCKDKVAVSDTLLVTLDNKVEKALPFEKGAFVIIIAGKHVGSTGTIEKIENGIITVKGEKEFTTKKGQAFVIGTGKAAMKIEA